MKDFYLRFADEAEANGVLFNQDDEGNVTPKFQNIDVIGAIYDGETPLDGYHANVRVVDEDSSALEPFAVFPSAPRRVWG